MNDWLYWGFFLSLLLLFAGIIIYAELLPEVVFDGSCYDSFGHEIYGLTCKVNERSDLAVNLSAASLIILILAVIVIPFFYYE